MVAGNEFNINRRQFFNISIGGLAGLLIHPDTALSSGEDYIVGIGKSSDPYEATMRAIMATEQWPAAELAGRTVLIKPNLVSDDRSDTGITTDPEVVRAIIDLSLANGAKKVKIVESGYGDAKFSSYGYDYLSTYHPLVDLYDLSESPLSLVKVGHPMAYPWMYVPQMLIEEDVFFISAAKMKTHTSTYATLSCKNLIGCGPLEKYNYPMDGLLSAYHFRGID